MKKLIPVVIAIALIGIVVAANFGKIIYDKYSYGQDTADLNEYFQIFKADDIPVILQDEKIEYRGTLIDGNVYFDKSTTDELFTDRFYLDSNENLVLYTLGAGTVKTVPGEKTYEFQDTVVTADLPLTIVKDDTLYIAADYIKKFFDFSYELFENPYHMQVYTEWGERKVADIKSDTQVRWRAGVKSEILREISEGETVELLDEIDNWTMVKTSDAYIGYVETFRLTNTRSEKEVAVKEAINDEITSLTGEGKINLTWHNMEYPQDGAGLASVSGPLKSVNVVSPTWYWINDNEGNFECLGNSDYVEAAHSMGMDVWALISDFHYGTDIDMNEVLSCTSRRKTLIDNLVSSVLSYNADGINIDFEKITSEAAPHYVQFIRELSLECHANNLILSVDVAPPTEYTAHYNRTAQGPFIDYLIIMGYDEHYAGCPEAGSVASINFVKEGIEDTLKCVPKEKIINAVPFYTRVWKTMGGDVESEAVDMQTSFDFISRNGIETKWDEATCQNYGEMTADGIYYQVWLEDTESLNVKLSVMTANGIAGIASWCVGQEVPEVWDLIENYMNN